jgi:hypothetical protein
MDGPVIVAILGAVFTLLGIGFWCWGQKEEHDYYNAIARRPDAREFVTRFPARPEPGGLKAGGYISLALGVVLLIAAVILWRAF